MNPKNQDERCFKWCVRGFLLELRKVNSAAREKAASTATSFLTRSVLETCLQLLCWTLLALKSGTRGGLRSWCGSGCTLSGEVQHSLRRLLCARPLCMLNRTSTRDQPFAAGGRSLLLTSQHGRPSEVTKARSFRKVSKPSPRITAAFVAVNH